MGFLLSLILASFCSCERILTLRDSLSYWSKKCNNSHFVSFFRTLKKFLLKTGLCISNILKETNQYTNFLLKWVQEMLLCCALEVCRSSIGRYELSSLLGSFRLLIYKDQRPIWSEQDTLNLLLKKWIFFKQKSWNLGY